MLEKGQMAVEPIPERAALTSEQEVICGDSLEVLRQISDCSIDAVVTDPPASISFMNVKWDDDKGGRKHWIAWLTSIMTECLRVLKPGGHMLVWALPRTSHWTATAIEDAGFEVRDVVMHLYGVGFPKSLSLSKAIDAHLGAERQVIGRRTEGRYQYAFSPEARAAMGPVAYEATQGWATDPAIITASATKEAERFEGFGTALKPAAEHWILARKPVEGTVAANVLAYGTGGLNIDACRIPAEGGNPSIQRRETSRRTGTVPINGLTAIESDATGQINRRGSAEAYMTPHRGEELGRWPAHVVLSHSPECIYSEMVDGWSCVLDCAVNLLDTQSGKLKSGVGNFRRKRHETTSMAGSLGDPRPGVEEVSYGDEGGASRFFYVTKPSRKEKEAGLEHLPHRTAGEVTGGREEGSAGLNNPRAGAGRTSGAKNFHPTIKSLDLMQWLIRLITPPGGLVLDPFAGSGSTLCAAALENMNCLGIEKEAEYIPIIEGRLAHWRKVAAGQ